MPESFQSLDLSLITLKFKGINPRIGMTQALWIIPK
jgi:hypothetical protein